MRSCSQATRGHSSWTRWGTCFVVLLGGQACLRESENDVPLKAKVFALSPQDYLGVRARIEGRVLSVGPAGSYFVFEDDTGRLLVSTERLPGAFACPGGHRVNLSGSLRKLDPAQGHYFSMENLNDCDQ